MAAGELMNKLLVAGLDDWLHLADVAWLVRQSQPGLAEPKLIRTSAEAIRSLLANGLAEVGDVTDGGFFAWALSTEDAVSRIKTEWHALGRDPVPGDVCWMANTTAGDRLARASLGQGDA